MKSLVSAVNDFLESINFVAPWLIRLGLGIAFIIHGLSKFPLPPEGLMNYFDFSPILASFVAVSELGAGIFIIFGGLIKSKIGDQITRFAALVIVVIMIFAFAIAHQDWFITTKLFTSEQIFLLLIGLYFILKGNN
tara:strand:+ start:1877 stop:2284 length:408 start_codon:yes stop_codon:yes gene_type:complete